MKVTLRPESEGDEAFLFKLYASTREDLSFLKGAQRFALLMMQFAAHERHYKASFPKADRKIILKEEKPIGRITSMKTESEIHLIDIALLPEHRGAGIGSTLIQGILSEASEKGLPVRLSVLKGCRAQRLYQRMSFLVVEESELYCFLERASDRL